MKKHLKLLLRIMVKIDVEAVLCISRHRFGIVPPYTHPTFRIGGVVWVSWDRKFIGPTLAECWGSAQGGYMWKAVKTIVGGAVTLLGLLSALHWRALDVAGRVLTMLDLGETYDSLLTWIATHPRLAVDFGPWILVTCGLASLCLTHWSSISHIWAPAVERPKAERVGDRREITEPAQGSVQPSGRWIGARYVCDTPFHVFTALITAQDNDRIQIFEVPYAPIDSLVETIVEIDRHDERVKAAVV